MIQKYTRENIERLKKEILEIEEHLTKYEKAEKEVKVGAYIFDKDAKKIAVVTQLKKGCTDFSADYLDGSYSRGYFYTVPNWELIERVREGEAV
ncbi:hypothetical protein NSS78_16320 [Bacillus sp. FSL W8-0920]|uniref:hypothetical protein n=1 Tax=Bacillus TaxID=1386 RepID=UPI0020A16E08|nr:hypothetical protein [Bacillus pumilus]MCP1528571.1 NDP-sugar pyrophosphorylase family protein [Bacillus pumilus]MDF9783951.1 NDP-sugar pyrophosphorylase family protein [Bacillus pumilus]